MKVALSDRYTGEVHTLRASIKPRVGFSLRGHLYLVIDTRPDFEITWNYWKDRQGVLVVANPEERRLFMKWEECGKEYDDQWWKKEA
ncbi:hypothetical protein ACH42_06945 [Endozoicomonas sp. (ex Bugula neritina AB1)]|nr:hypothetical protein ACH42_06945 [Endozoicomonas sp. (ex Bugula neritina AB1)]